MSQGNIIPIEPYAEAFLHGHVWKGKKAARGRGIQPSKLVALI